MPETNSIPIFLINLDRRPDRLAQMTTRLGNLPFTRIPAIDGGKLDDLEFKIPLKKYRISKNEIACLLSHRKVWAKIIDEEIAYACILEDDVYLSNSFPDFIRNTDWLPISFDLIKLETFMGRVYLYRKKITARERYLQELGVTHAGTAGYIFSIKGAIKFLNISRRLNMPPDGIFEVENFKNTELEILQLTPALCVQENILYPDAPFLSDLENDRSLILSKQHISILFKLWREIKRPFLQILNLIRVISKRLLITRVPFS